MSSINPGPVVFGVFVLKSVSLELLKNFRMPQHIRDRLGHIVGSGLRHAWHILRHMPYKSLHTPLPGVRHVGNERQRN